MVRTTAKVTAGPAHSRRPRCAHVGSSRARTLAPALLLALFITLLAGLRTSAQAQEPVAILDLGKGVLNGVTSVESGEPFEYALSYSCSSINVACKNVQLIDLLPPGLEFIDYVATSHVDTISESGGTVTVDFIDPVPGGSSGIIRFQVRFAPGAVPGDPGLETMPVINRATISADNAATKTATAPITLEEGSFQMFAQKNQLNEAVVGQPISFELELCSPDTQGGVPLTNPVFVDRLPPGATFVTATLAGGAGTDWVHDATAHTVTWINLPDPWPVGGCLTRTITITYDELPVPNDVQVNELIVTGIPRGCEAGFEPPASYCNPLNPTITLTDINSFLLEEPYGEWGVNKTANSTSSFLGSEALPGEQVTYDLDIVNSGFLTVTNGVITDTLPPEVSFDQVTFAPISGTSAISAFYSLRGDATLVPFPPPGPSYTSTVTVTLADLGLPPGSDIDLLRWEAPEPVAPRATWNTTVVVTMRLTAEVNSLVENCVEVSGISEDSRTEPPTTAYLETGDCALTEVISMRSIPRIQKTRGGDEGVYPEAEVPYTVRVYNATPAHLPAIEPVMMDLLPLPFNYVAGSFRIESLTPPTLTVPTLEVIDDFQGSGRTLLRAVWPPASELAPGASATFAYTIAVEEGTAPGVITNTAALLTNDLPPLTLNCSGDERYVDTQDLNGNGDTTETGCQSEAQVFIDVQLNVDTQKYVRGQFDDDWGVQGHTPQGGAADYRLVLTNTSNVPLTAIRIVDIMPWLGDVGVIDPSARGSEWQPTLQSRITGPTGIPFRVWYSESTNPCRTDLVPAGPVGCDPPNWSLDPPLDFTGQPNVTLARSVRIHLCDGGTIDQPSGCYALPRGEAIALVWKMVAPPNSPGSPECLNEIPGDACPIAWNSFAFTAQGGGLPFRPSEPPKVGIGLVPDAQLFVGDFYWLDVAGGLADGIQQPSEVGLNGRQVVLLEGDRPVALQSVLTATDARGRPGWYRFQILSEVFTTYRIGFEIPPGAQASPALQGSNVLSDSTGIELVSVLGLPDKVFIATAPFAVTGVVTEDLSLDQGIWYPVDMGDAPQGTVDGITYGYPTSIAASGGNLELAARNIIADSPGLTVLLGGRVDDERDGQPNVPATGDDITGGEFYTNTVLDDEDGVGFPGLIGPASAPSAILTRGSNTVAITNTIDIVGLPVTPLMQGWIDFNRDWQWNAGAERIINNLAAQNGVRNVTITVPNNAALGETYARFRLARETNLDPGGMAYYGETEDYRVQIVDVPLKRIVATSEAHTPVSAQANGNNTSVAIGEIVRYRLTAQLPRGELSNFRMVDSLPTGLLYIGNPTIILTAAVPSSITIPITAPVVTPASFSSGTDPTFTIGNITNSSSGAGIEYINLEFNALVRNETGNQDTPTSNSTRSNSFTVYYNNYSRASNSVNVIIREPALTQTKSVVAPPPLDAGATLTWTLVATAQSGAERTTAFDVVISDTIDSRLTLVPGSVQVTLAGGATGSTDSSSSSVISVTVTSMPVGSSATIRYRTTVNNEVIAGSTLPNRVRTTWTSLPGPLGTTTNPTGSATPGASGSANGERNGVTAPANLNNYTVAANAQVTLARPAFAKLQPSNPWTIGQPLTFTLAVTVPEGTLPNLVITDVLPAGLLYASQQVVTTAAASGGLLGADYAGTLPPPVVNPGAGDGNDITWGFGTIVNPADNNPANNSFLIQLAVVVRNVIANQDGVTLENRAQLGYTDGTTGAATMSGGSAVVRLVEPVLDLQKTAASAPGADAGDLVTYTLLLRHAAGSIIPAYDVVLTDTLPSTLRNAEFISATLGSGGAVSAGISGQTLRVPTSGTFTLPVTETLIIRYRARFDESAEPGVPITNTAGAIWASLPDSFVERRDDGVGAPDGEDLLGSGALNDYEVNASAQVTPSSAFTITKALLATSAAHTAGADVTIGEVITYQLRVTLTEDTSRDLVVTDEIPAGLAYVGGSAVVDATGFNGTLPAPVITPAGNGASGENLVLDFGDVIVIGDNILANNSFTITLRALVLDEAGNVGLPGQQTRLLNQATLQVANQPPAVSAQIPVDVVEPRMEIIKSITPTLAPPQSIVTVTIVVSNTGLSTAFEAEMDDLLPPGLTYAGGLVEVAGNGASAAVFVTTTTSVNAAWAEFPVGRSSTLRFRAQIGASVAPGAVLINTAQVSGATTLPGPDPNERTEPSDSDDAQVQIITHDLVLTKSSGRGDYEAGGLLIYTLSVTNTGAALAPGVRITEVVPNFTSFDAAAGSTGWMRADNAAQPCATGDPAGTVCALALGDLPPGAAREVQFAVRVLTPLPVVPPVIVNSACVDDDGSLGPEPTPSDNCDSLENSYVLAQLGDRVWLDINGNGIQDAAEGGYAGLVINLYRAADAATVISSTTSAADGSYVFTNLQPDSYLVEFVPIADPRLTLRLQGDDRALDSDADRITGFTDPVTLAAGEVNHTIDAGVYYLSALGDFVWEDLNANGIQEAGEPGIANVEVNLLQDVQGLVVISTTTTNLNGYYLFSDLDFGTYAVRVVVPADWRVSPRGVGGSGALDSDIDPVSGETATIAIAASIQNLDLDAGLHRLAALGDFAWADSNANGIQEAGEPGLAGVAVTLLPALDAQAAGAGQTLLTGVDGRYLFTDITPGAYVVQFAAPAPWRGSPQRAGNDRTTDSDPNPATGLTDAITLRSAQIDLTVDAGYYQFAAVGSYVWLDTNANGIREAGEPGFAGIPVQLFRDGEATPWRTQTSNAEGLFLFPDLPPGRYRLGFVATPPYIFTVRNATSDPMANSDVDPLTGQTNPFTLASGQTDLTWGAGLVLPTGDPPAVEPGAHRIWLPLVQGE